MRRKRCAKPAWHSIQCRDCGDLVEEYSDPDGSLELCSKCLHARWGDAQGRPPLQKKMDDDAWWDEFVFEYERLRALELIDENGRKK